MKGLELKVPPLAVVLVTALLMWLVARFVPASRFTLPARVLISASLEVVGAITCALGVVRFRRTKTTVNPMKPESACEVLPILPTSGSGFYVSVF